VRGDRVVAAGRTCEQWREEALQLAAKGLLACARIAVLMGDSGPDGAAFRDLMGVRCVTHCAGTPDAWCPVHGPGGHDG
jgi:hypothetical protein